MRFVKITIFDYTSFFISIFISGVLFMKLTELIIDDVKIGEGKSAVKGALVTVHYTGKLENGIVFDSSISKGRPFQFVLGAKKVIQGWDIGLIGLKVGGKRKLSIPSHLAYGERQIGEIIPSHSDLYFEIELLECLTRDE